MINVLDFIISNVIDKKRGKTPEWEPEPLHISPPPPKKEKKEKKEDNGGNVIIIDI